VSNESSLGSGTFWHKETINGFGCQGDYFRKNRSICAGLLRVISDVNNNFKISKPKPHTKNKIEGEDCSL